MKPYYNIVLFFFILNFSFSYCQIINFTVKDEQAIYIPNCNILFKDNSTNKILEFTKIYNGSGTYVLKKTYSATISISVNCAGFYPQEVFIENHLKENKYSFDIILKKDNTNHIEEVIVRSKEKPFKTTKDTVTFDVSKYKDGSEHKVEDIIKKLPGVTVDASGTISYKGKKLETVTLDGDNIFDRNYKLGTKNINVDMVEQIQAIENYASNSLLKGIESEGKVSLNLKLKKGKSDYSGNLENGLGIKETKNMAFYSQSYSMQISSRTKSFANLNFNNIGRSDAYFYEKQDSKSLDRKSDDDFMTKKLIAEDLFSPQLDPVRYNRNKQLYISYNNLFKLNKKITLKSNLNFIEDKINSEQNVFTQNFINTSTFETSDNNSLVKKPKIFAGEFEIKINTSAKTLLEIYSKQYLEKTDLFGSYKKNDLTEFSNIVKTQSYFNINKLVHTWKVDKNKALQANFYYTYNKIPQQFTSNSVSENILQTSEFVKKNVLFNYNLIGKYKYLSYTFQIGANIEKTPYLSDNTFVQNKTHFKNEVIYSFNRIVLKFNQLSITPKIAFTNYRFSLININETNENKSKQTTIEPSLDFTFRQKKTTISLAFSNFKKPISEENIFTQNVYINNRTTILNKPSFDFQKTDTYRFSYMFNELDTSTNINFSTTYSISNGKYLSNFTINEFSSVISSQFYAIENTSLNNNLRFSRFFKKLSSTITYSSNYIVNENPNFINSSDIRKNSNTIFKNTLEIRTGFDYKINFENVFSQSKSTSKSIITNSISSLQNSFKVKWKISKNSSCNLKSDFFIPNLKNKSNTYHFLDYEYKYKFNEKINLTLIANNILNLKTYNQVENNDFSNYTSETNLTPRLAFLVVEYSF